MTILDGLGIVGGVAFAFGEVISARKDKQKLSARIGAATLTAYGGGAVLRDVLTLQKIPLIFSALTEFVVFAVIIACTALFAVAVNRKNNNLKFNGLLCYIWLCGDSVGIMMFAKNGFDRGFDISGSFVTSLICGIVTAIGGGMLAIILKGILKNDRSYITKKLKSKLPYHGFGIGMTFLYSLFAICGNNEYATIIVLFPMAIFFGYLAEIKITEKK